MLFDDYVDMYFDLTDQLHIPAHHQHQVTKHAIQVSHAQEKLRVWGAWRLSWMLACFYVLGLSRTDRTSRPKSTL